MKFFHKIHWLLFAAFSIGFFVFHAAATTYYVDINSANPTPPYTSWNTAATNIQSAVSQTTNGDTILVNPGVYQTFGVLAGSPPTFYLVAVTNAITLESASGPAVTSIGFPTPNEYLVSCVYMTNGAVLSGFTITGGSGYDSIGGAGIFATSTNATITNCIITQCTVQGDGSQFGAGVYSGTLYNCLLTANTNLNGSGGAAAGSTMFNCMISNNFAVNGGGISGGILNNCVVADNSASGSGGGAYNSSTTNASNCTLNSCTIVFNSSGGYAGGSDNALLNNCLVCSNSVGGYGAGGGVCGGILNNCTIVANSANYGGGVYADTVSSVFLNQCIISNNVAGYGGGGVFNGGSGYSYDYCILNNCTLTANSTALNDAGGAWGAEMNNCLISSNSAPTASGGGVEYGYLNNCLLIGNSAGFTGGGADGSYANYLPDTLLTNCVLIGNSAQFAGGGALSATLVNCTIVDNSAPQRGGGMADCEADNCILYDNTGGDYGVWDAYFEMPSNIINFSCTSLMPTNGVGNITNAPLFVNAAAGNFQLQDNSPCINSGNNAYVSMATDLAGNPRIVGGTVDMGAYEYQTPVSMTSYAWLEQYGLPITNNIDTSDPNGTGFDVYQDWVTGLNPTNSASVLAMLTPAATNNASGITITWQSAYDIGYLVQRSTNLLSQPFTTIAIVVGQTNTTSYTDTSAIGNVPYFYRVGVPAP